MTIILYFMHLSEVKELPSLEAADGVTDPTVAAGNVLIYPALLDNYLPVVHDDFVVDLQRRTSYDAV